jgi:hypothetical protein
LQTLDFVTSIFIALSSAALLLYLVCHLRPQLVSPHVSIPDVFLLRWNIGREAFELQTALYSVFHRSVVDDVCHHFLTLDQLAWAALAYHFGGAAGLLGLALLALLQAATFGERAIVGMMAAVWGLIAAATVWLAAALGPDLAVTAEAVLLTSAMLRVLGHAFEPLPPLVGDSSLNFTPMRLRQRFPVTFVLGWVAEFASGLPFRLYASQVYLMALRFGFEPRSGLTLARLRELSGLLGTYGFAAWPTTRAMFPWHPACADPASTKAYSGAPR